MRERLKSWRAGMPRRFSRSERGATAVEFALVAGPLLLLLGVTCETGIMLFAEYTLQNAAQVAARTVRTGQASGANGAAAMTASQFKTIICNNVGFMLDCNGKVTVYVNNAAAFSSLESTMADPLTVGPSGGGGPPPVIFNPGIQLRAATVIATYDWDLVFPFMNNFVGNISGNTARRIYGLAIFRNEPFGAITP